MRSLAVFPPKSVLFFKQFKLEIEKEGTIASVSKKEVCPCHFCFGPQSLVQAALNSRMFDSGLRPGIPWGEVNIEEYCDFVVFGRVLPICWLRRKW